MVPLARSIYTAERTYPRMTRISLEDARVGGVLSEKRVLRIATVDAHCSPHVSSVWFIFENGVFWISTAEDRLKVKNIKTNPNVSLIVDTDEPPYKGVIVEGKAELVTENVFEVTKRITQKYVDPASLDSTLKELMRAPRILIKVEPRKAMDIMSYPQH
jgi:PPOX class probable F420-dependent enzyme